MPGFPAFKLGAADMEKLLIIDRSFDHDETEPRRELVELARAQRESTPKSEVVTIPL
jgi:hypothetical protein